MIQQARMEVREMVKKYYMKKQNRRLILSLSVDGVGDSVVLVDVIGVVTLEVSNLNITQKSHIVAVLSQVVNKSNVLLLNGILTKRWQEEQGEEGREETQSRRDVEGGLDTGVTLKTTMLSDNDWENVSTNKSTDLTNSGGDTVVLTSDRSSRSLGSQTSNVVTSTKLTKSDENTKNNDETGNVVLQVWVASGHTDTNSTLKNKTNDKGHSWAKEVTEPTTQNGTWHVEQVENNVPTPSLVNIVVRQNDREDERRVKTKRVSREIVNEPQNRHNGQSEPIVLNDEPKWVLLNLLHVKLSECIRVLNLHTHEEQDEWWEDTQTQGESPDSVQVSWGKDPQQDQWNERGDDETHVDSEVSEPTEVSVSVSRRQLVSKLRGNDGGSRVLSTDGNTQEKSEYSDGGEQTLWGLAPGSDSTKKGEENKHHVSDKHTTSTGIMVRDVTKTQLTDHGTSKGNCRNVGDGRGVLVLLTIDKRQTGCDSGNGVVHVTIGEQTSTRNKSRPQVLGGDLLLFSLLIVLRLWFHTELLGNSLDPAGTGIAERFRQVS